MPKVSVVMPSYNHAAYVADAVVSVLNQSEPDLELIVVDDGSSDNTLEILQAVKDPRLRLIPRQTREPMQPSTAACEKLPGNISRSSIPMTPITRAGLRRLWRFWTQIPMRD